MATYSFTPAQAKTSYDAVVTATTNFETTYEFAPEVIVTDRETFLKARWWQTSGRNRGIQDQPPSVTLTYTYPLGMSEIAGRKIVAGYDTNLGAIRNVAVVVVTIT